MRSSRIIMGFLIAIFAFACLFAIPVLAIEGPWDADNDDGTGGNDGTSDDNDTTIINDDTQFDTDDPVDDGIPDWLIGFMLRYSNPFMFGYLMDSQASTNNNLLMGKSLPESPDRKGSSINQLK